MPAEKYKENAIQYRTAVFEYGKFNLRAFCIGIPCYRWYSSPRYVKCECSKDAKVNIWNTDVLETHIHTDNYTDLTYPDGFVLTAEMCRQRDIERLERKKNTTYHVIYHDATGFYDYDTKELLLSMEDYNAEQDRLRRLCDAAMHKE